MFVTSFEGSVYPLIDINAIRFHLNNKSLFGKINQDRQLNYDKESIAGKEVIKGFINDLTQDELEDGLIEVERLCKESNNLELLEDYYTIFFNNDNEKVLAKLKELKLFEVNQKYNLEIETVLKEYIPDTEKLTWDIQEKESRAFKSSNYEDESVCPFMKKLSTIRNYSLKDLCDKVIYKADLYRESISILVGLRQSLQDKIDKSISKDELKSIDFNNKLLEIYSSFKHL